jgi:hypothetical protein
VAFDVPLPQAATEAARREAAAAAAALREQLGVVHATEVRQLREAMDDELRRRDEAARALRAAAARKAAVAEAEAQRRQATAVLEATAGMVSVSELERDVQVNARLEATMAERETLLADRRTLTRKLAVVELDLAAACDERDQQREAVREVELLVARAAKGSSGGSGGHAGTLAKQLVHAKLAAADLTTKLRVAARAELELRQLLVSRDERVRELRDATAAKATAYDVLSRHFKELTRQLPSVPRARIEKAEAAVRAAADEAGRAADRAEAERRRKTRSAAAGGSVAEDSGSQGLLDELEMARKDAQIASLQLQLAQVVGRVTLGGGQGKARRTSDVSAEEERSMEKGKQEVEHAAAVQAAAAAQMGVAAEVARLEERIRRLEGTYAATSSSSGPEAAAAAAAMQHPSRRHPWGRIGQSSQAAGSTEAETVVSESSLDTLSQRLCEMEQRAASEGHHGAASSTHGAQLSSHGASLYNSQTASQRTAQPWATLPPRDSSAAASTHARAPPSVQRSAADTAHFVPSDVLASRTTRSERTSAHSHMTGMELGGVSCTTCSDEGSVHGEVHTGSQPLPATDFQHGTAPSEAGAATVTGSRSSSCDASAHEASAGAAELQEELQALRARATTAEVQAAHERATAAALRLDAASAVEVVNTTLAVVSGPVATMQLPHDTSVHVAVMHLASRLGAATLAGAAAGSGGAEGGGGSGPYTDPQRLELSRRAVITDLSAQLAASLAENKRVVDDNERLSARLANLHGAFGTNASMEAAPEPAGSRGSGSQKAAGWLLDRRPVPVTSQAQVQCVGEAVANATLRASVARGLTAPGPGDDHGEGVQARSLCSLIMQHLEALEGTQAQLAELAHGLRTSPNMAETVGSGGGGGADRWRDSAGSGRSSASSRGTTASSSTPAAGCNSTGKSAVRAAKAANADALQEMATLMASEVGALRAAAHVLLTEMEGNWLQPRPTENERELLRRLKQARAEAEGQRKRAYKWKDREAELRTKVGFICVDRCQSHVVLPGWHHLPGRVMPKEQQLCEAIDWASDRRRVGGDVDLCGPMWVGMGEESGQAAWGHGGCRWVSWRGVSRRWWESSMQCCSSAMTASARARRRRCSSCGSFRAGRRRGGASTTMTRRKWTRTSC